MRDRRIGGRLRQRRGRPRRRFRRGRRRRDDDVPDDRRVRGGRRQRRAGRPLREPRPYRPQRLAHVRPVAVAARGVLQHGALDHLPQRGRHARRHGRERLRLVLHHLEEDGVQRVRLEGLAVRQQLVEHGAQREHVRARRRLLAADLLGRHVVGRAHDHARAGHVGRRHLGQAEVHDLDLAAALDVDVRGLQVAVDDVLRVGEGEAVADLLHEPELLLERQGRVAADEVLEVVALQELHRHVDLALVFAEVEDGDDVGVVEPRGRLGLAVEALPQLFVGADRRRHRLDGDVAAEDGVVGLEDLAHGALADLADDLVLTQLTEIHHTSAPGAGAERQRIIARGFWAGTAVRAAS